MRKRRYGIVLAVFGMAMAFCLGAPPRKPVTMREPEEVLLIIPTQFELRLLPVDRPRLGVEGLPVLSQEPKDIWTVYGGWWYVHIIPSEKVARGNLFD